jgi:hypothetical protein
LEEGCAWPDVPSQSDQGNYVKFGVVYLLHLAGWEAKESETYRSHFGDLQNWHSMCPKESGVRLKNSQVKEKILGHLQGWYTEAMACGNQRRGLFHIGKMMHTLQDSYCLSHCWRRFVNDRADETPIAKENEWKIWSFQSYDLQDSDAHGVADKAALPIKEKTVPTVGYEKARAASKYLLSAYKKNSPWSVIHEWLDKEVYSIYPGREKEEAGLSHPWFRKESAYSSEWVEAQLTKLSKEVKT